MAIDKGNIKTSANYDVRAQKPLDGRAVRPTKADLIKKESWSSDGSTVYVYEGMQVYVQDEKKTYYLKDLSKMFEPDYSGWDEMLTAPTGAGGGLEYLEFDDPTTADEVMSIISTIQQRYDTTGKMPVAWINGNGGHSLISQIIYQSERDGVLVTRLMDSEVMYFVTSGALLVVQSSLVMRLDASASDNNKMVAALLQLVSFTQWQMFNIPIYLEIDGVMYEAVSKSKELNGTVYGSFVVGNTLKIYKLTHSENGVYVPLLKSEIPLGGGGSITLDSEMSDTSENAVGNKVIKEYVDNAAPRQFGDDFSEDFN